MADFDQRIDVLLRDHAESLDDQLYFLSNREPNSDELKGVFDLIIADLEEAVDLFPDEGSSDLQEIFNEFLASLHDDAPKAFADEKFDGGVGVIKDFDSGSEASLQVKAWADAFYQWLGTFLDDSDEGSSDEDESSEDDVEGESSEEGYGELLPEGYDESQWGFMAVPVDSEEWQNFGNYLRNFGEREPEYLYFLWVTEFREGTLKYVETDKAAGRFERVQRLYEYPRYTDYPWSGYISDEEVWDPFMELLGQDKNSDEYKVCDWVARHYNDPPLTHRPDDLKFVYERVTAAFETLWNGGELLSMDAAREQLETYEAALGKKIISIEELAQEEVAEEVRTQVKDLMIVEAKAGDTTLNTQVSSEVFRRTLEAIGAIDIGWVIDAAISNFKIAISKGTDPKAMKIGPGKSLRSVQYDRGDEGIFLRGSLTGNEDQEIELHAEAILTPEMANESNSSNDLLKNWQVGDKRTFTQCGQVALFERPDSEFFYYYIFTKYFCSVEGSIGTDEAAGDVIRLPDEGGQRRYKITPIPGQIQDDCNKALRRAFGETSATPSGRLMRIVFGDAPLTKDAHLADLSQSFLDEVSAQALKDIDVDDDLRFIFTSERGGLILIEPRNPDPEVTKHWKVIEEEGKAVVGKVSMSRKGSLFGGAGKLYAMMPQRRFDDVKRALARFTKKKVERVDSLVDKG
ncbi:MAG: hypothetical protein H0T78_02595 [Longispora sp.]|nr:hypothetical protein [Longispora sp. (in: high G+C Gram-positive bacteria)]